jgi:Flp pilus assembly protein TadD
MNMRSKIIPAALLLALAATGCSTVKNMVNGTPDPDHVARVQIDYQGEKVEATVVASSNENSQNGVNHMRNEDWDKAGAEFQKAITANDKDFKSHFGLGVAEEMQKQYPAAETQYKAANFYHADPAYAAALRRIHALQNP